MNPFIEPLAKALSEFSIVSVYTDRSEPDHFAAGFVAAVSDDYVILKHVTPTGRYDGYALRRMEDVFRLDSGGEYEKALAALYRFHGDSHSELESLQNGEDLFEATLLAARVKGWPVSVYLSRDGDWECVSGMVFGTDGETVVIHAFRPNGKADGESMIAIGEITSINMDCEEDRAWAVLARIQTEKG